MAPGQKRAEFSVLGHTLTPSTEVDGLLGLDYFRGLSLTIDFHEYIGKGPVFEPLKTKTSFRRG